MYAGLSLLLARGASRADAGLCPSHVHVHAKAPPLSRRIHSAPAHRSPPSLTYVHFSTAVLLTLSRFPCVRVFVAPSTWCPHIPVPRRRPCALKNQRSPARPRGRFAGHLCVLCWVRFVLLFDCSTERRSDYFMQGCLCSSRRLSHRRRIRVSRDSPNTPPPRPYTSRDGACSNSNAPVPPR